MDLRSLFAKPQVDPRDRDLPPYVTDNRRFYRRTTRHARVGYGLSELTAIAAAAAVPVAVAAGSKGALPAVLGALAATASGLRSAFHFRENWIMRSTALIGIERLIALHYEGLPPLSSGDLVERVSVIVRTETNGWERAMTATADVGIGSGATQRAHDADASAAESAGANPD